MKESEKFSENNIFEGMTSISAVINSPDENDRKILKIYVDKTRLSSKEREINFLKYKSRELGFCIEFSEPDFIDSRTVGNSHGGIIAECTDRTIPSLSTRTVRDDGFYVYMDGIEDPYNFGYSLRSLYAAGVDGIVLPERNWFGAAGTVARASAGTSELLNVYSASPEDAVGFFRSNGYTIACAGIRDSVSIYETEIKYPLLLVIGGEKRGISRSVLDLSDVILRIDYGRSFKGSLSAASAASVMAFEIMRQNMKK